FWRAGRSNEKYRVESGVVHYPRIFVRFLNCQVGCEHTVEPGRCAVFSELLEPIIKQRIVITEEQQWNLRPLPDFGAELKNLAQADAVGQCPFGSALNNRSVRNGIREGYT